MRRAAAAMAASAAILWISARAPVAPHTSVVWVYFHPDSTYPYAPHTSPDGAGDTVLEDLPVPPHLVTRVARTGAVIRHESRWLRAVSVEASPSELRSIRRVRAVAAIRPVGMVMTAGASMAASAARAARQVQDSTDYGPNFRAMRELGIPAAHLEGYRGSGIRVAILDTGFDTGHESLSGLTVIAARDFVNDDLVVADEPGDPPNQARHGTRVWSIVGAYRPGTMVGAAHEAEFILAKVKSEPNVSSADEDRWVAGVEWAESHGARLIVSALYFRTGFTDRPDILYGALNGDSTVTTRVADEAARRGTLVVNAIGDLGPQPRTLAAPADGDSVLAVGAVDANGDPAELGVAAGTSRGPTADGRIKPDVVARGTEMFAASSTSPTAYDIGIEGTSYSTALVGGGVALFMDAWPELSAAAARRAITLAGTNAASPDNAVGSGIPNVAAAILFPEGLRPVSIGTVDASNRLTTLGPTFTWNAAPGPRGFGSVLYRLQVATDPQFTNIVFTDTVRDAFALRARRPISPANELYWRVVASTSAGVTRNSSISESFSVPGWVRLLDPDPTQVTHVNTPRPTLRWSPLAAPAPIGPLVYDLEILSHENGQPVQPAQRNLTSATVQVAAPLVPNTAYRWRVIVRTQTGAADTVESTNPFVVTSDSQPPATLLYQNFPNPFPRSDLGAQSTQVWFDLAEQSTIELVVLDLGGRFVKRLTPADPSCGAVTLDPGIYGRSGPFEEDDPCVGTSWDGTDARGTLMPRGIYVLRLRTNGRDLYRRMLFLPG
jgi:hypothetical protein